MSNITYLKGDASLPIDTASPRIIAHVVNNIGVWGAGFVLSLNKYPQVKEKYLTACREIERDVLLGRNQYVHVENDFVVANMFAQNGIRSYTNHTPLKYELLQECLDRLVTKAEGMDATIHMPKIGSGLAGGDWKIIEKMVEDILTSPVYVYTLEGTTKEVFNLCY